MAFRYQVRGNCIVSYYDSGKTGSTARQREALNAGRKEGEKSINVSDVAKQSFSRIFTVIAQSNTISKMSGDYAGPKRINFITLTMPAYLDITARELYRDFLNTFLVRLKEKYSFSFYVWKLELQKNGRFHYHIVTDCDVCTDNIRLLWNDILRGRGVVDLYRAERENFHKNGFQYCPEMGKTHDENTQKGWYYYGIMTGWSNPRTADVRTIDSVSNMAFYLSKYVGKNNDTDKTGGRSWGCSDNCRKLKYFSFSEADYGYNPLLSLMAGGCQVSEMGEWVKIFQTGDVIPKIDRRKKLWKDLKMWAWENNCLF